MSEIYVHGLGGAGIKLAKSIDGNILLGDTSSANDKKAFVFAGANGSGGIRTTNVDDIVNGMEEYLRNGRLGQPMRDRAHIILLSASGGSGSTIGPVLIKHLLDRGEIVIPFVVLDKRDFVSLTNTESTIKTLVAIGLKAGTSLTAFVFDNDEGTDVVDDQIRKEVGNITTFLEGNVDGIDIEDMRNFLSPTNYAKLGLPNGLYIAHDVHRRTEGVNGTTFMARVSYTKEPHYMDGLSHIKIGKYIGKEKGGDIAIVVESGCIQGLLSSIDEEKKRYAAPKIIDTFEDVADELEL